MGCNTLFWELCCFGQLQTSYNLLVLLVHLSTCFVIYKHNLKSIYAWIYAFIDLRYTQANVINCLHCAYVSKSYTHPVTDRMD